MKHFGSIVLSYEEVGGLGELLPWKVVDADGFTRPGGKLAGVPWDGFLAVSTCNRVEFIYSVDGQTTHQEVYAALLECMPALPEGVRPKQLVGRRAGEHLVRLAAGLESLVLGESEIKAQLLQAKHRAREAGQLHPGLDTLLQQVFRESREIRNQIPMHRLPLSLPALAARKLRAGQTHSADVDSLSHDTAACIVIGSGPMSRQAAEYIAKWSPRLVWVNRSIEKIDSAAARLGAQCLSFEDFLANPAQVGPVSGILTATSHPSAFIDADLLGRMQLASSVVLVDLALPNDVAENVASRPSIDLVNLDSLRAELESNRERREEAAREADELVIDALVRIEARLIAQRSGPILRKVQQRIRERSRRHLEELLERRLAHLGARDRRALYQWAIRSNRDLNRIHRQGVEDVLEEYYAQVIQTG